MLKLTGLLIVVIGFAARVNPLLVVLLAAVVTGLTAGFSLHEVVTMVGELFVANRFMMLPIVLMLPVVGLLERHGLQEHVAQLMRRTRAASAGRVLILYQLLRQVTSTLGLSIGNHASMVRPLVVPLAESAAQRDDSEPPNGTAPQQVRAHAAAAENVGNFFGDDLLVAVGALLLIQGFFASVDVDVRLRDLQLWSAPTALVALLVGGWRYRRLDRTLRQTAEEKKP